MKTLFLIALQVILTALFIQAQVEDATESNAYNQRPKFFQDFLEFSAGKKDLTRLDAFVLVPFTTVQFVKSNKGFNGSYSVTISVFDKDKEKLIEEKSWNENISAKDFNETTNKENYNLNLKSFYLQPGDYVIRTAVEDKESSAEYPKEVKLKIRDFSGELAISDIMLLDKRVKEEGKNKISPNVTGNVALQKDGLPIFFEIYSKEPQKLNIDYKVLDRRKDPIYKNIELKNIDTGRTQIFYTIRDSSFSLGLYNLKIELKDSANKTLASITRPFYSRWAGIPSTISDLSKAVEEMVYIASPSDIAEIKSAKTKDEELKRFLAYWKKMDPTPGTGENEIFDEYYRRVAYANEHFSHYIPGWRSDQGMVFILLGPPDNVDRHPFDIDSKPYEIWQYYTLNRSFIFVDETGFGDYRLITPLTGDLYKFRR